MKDDSPATAAFNEQVHSSEDKHSQQQQSAPVHIKLDFESIQASIQPLSKKGPGFSGIKRTTSTTTACAKQENFVEAVQNENGSLSLKIKIPAAPLPTTVAVEGTLSTCLKPIPALTKSKSYTPSGIQKAPMGRKRLAGMKRAQAAASGVPLCEKEPCEPMTPNNLYSNYYVEDQQQNSIMMNEITGVNNNVGPCECECMLQQHEHNHQANNYYLYGEEEEPCPCCNGGAPMEEDIPLPSSAKLHL